MTGSEDAGETDSAEGERGGPQRDLKRRLEQVFGDVLPDTTRDEREPPLPQDDDDHLRREVPPHHG